MTITQTFLYLIRQFEEAAREEDRLDSLASDDPDNDELRAKADAADRRRLEAADALAQAIRAREVAAGNVSSFAVPYRGRVYYAELVGRGGYPPHDPLPVFRLGCMKLLSTAED